MNEESRDKPVDRHAAAKKAREKRLAAALRANLRRRKAAVQGPKGDAPVPVRPTSCSDESS